jgi:hypothetical protein
MQWHQRAPSGSAGASPNYRPVAALWDTTFASHKRRITPMEQHAHSFLELMPLMAVLHENCRDRRDGTDRICKRRSPVFAWSCSHFHEQKRRLPSSEAKRVDISRSTSPSYWLPHLDEAVVADTLVSDRATLPEYVQKRRKLRLPLFYEPRRTPCGENANPQWQSLRITSVRPNHGGRYRFDR